MQAYRCRCPASANSKAEVNPGTYWPAQYQQRTAAMMCMTHVGHPSRSTQQLQAAVYCVARHEVHAHAQIPSSRPSSSSLQLGRPQKHRAAIITHSTGNGRSNRNNISNTSDTRQQASTSSTQQWQVVSQQQQPQQQEQQQPSWQSDRRSSSRMLQQRRAASIQEQQSQWQYEQQVQQQQQQGYAGDEQDLVMPRQRFALRSYNRFTGAWYKSPAYKDLKDLHMAILQRCGKGSYQEDALKHLLSISTTQRDAQLALSAVTAVRGVSVSRGKMAPWPDAFTKLFVKMCALCDAHDVLLSAMQRPAELGFVFKWKSLLVALKHWGDQCDVDKLEQIAHVMEDAGLAPDERMAYVIVRACVNSKQWDRIDRVLAWFGSKGVERAEFRPTFLRLLEAAQTAKAGGDSDIEAAAAAAATSVLSGGSSIDE